MAPPVQRLPLQRVVVAAFHSEHRTLFVASPAALALQQVLNLLENFASPFFFFKYITVCWNGGLDCLTGSLWAFASSRSPNYFLRTR